MVGIGAYSGFFIYRTALFSTKTNHGRYFFIGPNSLSRAEDLAAVNHVTQAVVRVGSTLGS